jgi:hypothetical protein
VYLRLRPRQIQIVAYPHGKPCHSKQNPSDLLGSAYFRPRVLLRPDIERRWHRTGGDCRRGIVPCPALLVHATYCTLYRYTSAATSLGDLRNDTAVLEKEASGGGGGGGGSSSNSSPSDALMHACMHRQTCMQSPRLSYNTKKKCTSSLE